MGDSGNGFSTVAGMWWPSRSRHAFGAVPAHLPAATPSAQQLRERVAMAARACMPSRPVGLPTATSAPSSLCAKPALPTVFHSHDPEWSVHRCSRRGSPSAPAPPTLRRPGMPNVRGSPQQLSEADVSALEIPVRAPERTRLQPAGPVISAENDAAGSILTQPVSGIGCAKGDVTAHEGGTSRSRATANCAGSQKSFAVFRMTDNMVAPAPASPKRRQRSRQCPRRRAHCNDEQPLSQRQKQNIFTFQVPYGRVVIQMRPDLAPKHVAQIKKLAREGKYNGVVSRVIEGSWPRPVTHVTRTAAWASC